MSSSVVISILGVTSSAVAASRQPFYRGKSSVITFSGNMANPHATHNDFAGKLSIADFLYPQGIMHQSRKSAIKGRWVSSVRSRKKSVRQSAGSPGYSRKRAKTSRTQTTAKKKHRCDFRHHLRPQLPMP